MYSIFPHFFLFVESGEGFWKPVTLIFKSLTHFISARDWMILTHQVRYFAVWDAGRVASFRHHVLDWSSRQWPRLIGYSAQLFELKMTYYRAINAPRGCLGGQSLSWPSVHYSFKRGGDTSRIILPLRLMRAGSIAGVGAEIAPSQFVRPWYNFLPHRCHWGKWHKNLCQITPPPWF